MSRHSLLLASLLTLAPLAEEIGPVLVRSLCISCHSTMVIERARKTPSQWESTLRKMETNGMPPLSPALREPLLRFLSGTRGPSDTNRGQRGPWADHRNANPLW